MAVVTVQLGQAGNQAGHEMLRSLWQHHHGSETNEAQDTISRFFRETKKAREGASHVARAVCVDTESKVIAGITEAQRASKAWAYDDKRILYTKRGAGNNWANGYFNYGKVHVPDILNMIRREMEMCDYVEGFSVLQSVAGGTGSGLGAAVLDALQDEFPNVPSWAKIIWPHMTGETVVQSYNCVLSMAHAYQACDGILLLENDHLQDICHRMLRLKQVTVSDLNKVIAQQLVAVMSCTRAASPQNFSHTPSVTSSFGELLRAACPHPDLKLVRLRLVPQMPQTYQAFTRYEWAPLIKTALAMADAGAHLEEGFDRHAARRSGHSPAPTTTAHGPARASSLPTALSTTTASSSSFPSCSTSSARCAPPFASAASSVTAGRRGHATMAAWERPNTCVSRLLFCHGEDLGSGSLPPAQAAHTRVFVSGTTRIASNRKSVALLSNEKAVAQPLDTVTNKAWRMFQHRAFLHQYAAYGLHEGDFEQLFVPLQQLLRAYVSL